jgi:hypothetical protein
MRLTNKKSGLRIVTNPINYCLGNNGFTMVGNRKQPIIISNQPCEDIMFLRGFCLLVTLFLSLHFNPIIAQIPAFRQHPFPENVDVLDTAKNALPLELNCLAQTPDGILWMGSNRGLIRYDGVQTQLFSTESGVISLFSSAKRGLYLGCASGQISIFNKNKIINWTPEEGLPKVKITGFAEDTSGNLWFSTYGAGAYCFDGKKLHHFTTKDNLLANIIDDIAQNQDNEILLATDKGMSVCQLIKGNKIIKNVVNGNDLADLKIKAFTKLPSSDVFAGFRNGNFGNLKTHNWTKINGSISCLTQFEQNDFVVGTEENGLFFVDLFHERTDKAPPSVGRI